MNSKFKRWLEAQTYDLVGNMDNDWGWKVINRPYDVVSNFCWDEIIEITDEPKIYRMVWNAIYLYKDGD
jgi:hypothetical protein